MFQYYLKSYIVNRCDPVILWSWIFRLFSIQHDNNCASLYLSLMIFSVDFWNCSFWYILTDIPKVHTNIMNCFSVTFSFTKITWKKWLSFYCFVGTFWTRKCAVLVFRKSNPRQKLFLKKKKKGYGPVEKSWLTGWHITLPSSCLADVFLESLRGCVMRGKNERDDGE